MSLCIGTAHSIWLSADLVCPHWCRAQTCSKTGPLLQTGDAKQSFKIKAFDKDHQTLLNWSFQPTEKESQKQDVKKKPHKISKNSRQKPTGIHGSSLLLSLRLFFGALRGWETHRLASKWRRSCSKSRRSMTQRWLNEYLR